MSILITQLEKTSGLNFSIKKCAAWAGDLSNCQDWQLFVRGEKPISSELSLPALKQIPAMQRRRLSPFAKLALHCALEAGEGYLDTVPSVFASRHGDLQKTSKLISDVAAEQELSPTQFGLSVHNAVGGLFSIYAGNKAPLTAISAGEDTFLASIIDAVSKMESNDYPRILLVYTETVVPDIYQQYVLQEEVSISTALLIEKVSTDKDNFSLSIDQNKNQDAKENSCLQALDFLRFYYSQQKQAKIESKRHIWTLNRI